MALTTQEQILVEQRVTNQSQSVGVAYLLLIFLGGLGIHRFYLGKTGTGAAMLILSILGWLTLAIVIGAAFLIVVGIWWIVDLFLIPGMVETQRQAVRQSITQQVQAQQVQAQQVQPA